MCSEVQTGSHVYWLFGLSGAGKSTLGAALAAGLRQRGVAVLMLDGDTLRMGLCSGLGFSDEDRRENLRRAAEVAKLGTTSGLTVIASFITPLESHRRLVMAIIGRPHVSMVYLDAPLAVCRQRDVKGLYARAQQGLVSSMTGISSAFELPTNPDLSLHTDAESIETSAAKLIGFADIRPGVPR